MSSNTKREKFEQIGGKGLKTSLIRWAAGILVITLPVALFFLEGSGQSEINRPKVAKPREYREIVKMTAVRTKEENGQISIKLDDILKNRLVNFYYEGKRIPDGTSTKALSLMAYITPSGELFAGTAYCPPCRSDKHFIDKDGTLTCDLCDTKRDLDSLKGLQGGCVDYPPDEFDVEISNGLVNIDIRDLKAWSPKPL